MKLQRKRVLWKRNGALTVAWALLITLYPPLPALSGTITDEIKTVVDRIVTVLTDPAFTAPEKKQERDKLLHTIASERFDWEEMAKRSIGTTWRELSQAQQQEFIAVFVDFLERTYLAKIDQFLQKSKDFSSRNITYTKETVEGRYALIESVIRIQDQQLPLHYKMIQKNNTWKVYDVTIEGIGLVANYRSQFSEILAKESFESLMKRLREKQSDAALGGKALAPLSDSNRSAPL